MNKFKPGDLITVVDRTGLAAAIGATAVVQDPAYQHSIYDRVGHKIWLKVEWVRNTLDNFQSDGCYEDKSFELVTPPLDLSKPVQTKAGVPVRILCTDADKTGPVVGIVGTAVLTWTLSGHCHLAGCHYDLMNVPPPPPAKVTTTVYLWRSISLTGKPPRIFTTISPDKRGDATLLGKQEVTVTEGDNVNG